MWPDRGGAIVPGMARRIAASACAAVALAGLGGSASHAGGTPTLIFASDRGPDYQAEVYAVRVSTGARIDLSRNPQSDLAVAPDPRGALVAFASNRTGAFALYTAGLAGQPPRRIAPLPGMAGVTRVVWSPSGDALLAQGLGPRGTTLELLTRSGHRLLEVPTSLGLTLAPWSADGRRFSYLVSAGKRTDVRIVDRRGRTAFERPGQDAFWAQRAPRVAIVGGLLGDALPGSTSVFDEAGHEVRHLSGRRETLSPDGRDIVLARSHTTVIAYLDDRRVRLLPAGALATATFSPDGTRLEVPLLHGSAVVLSVATGHVEARLSAAGAWLPNGREIVVFNPVRTGAWIVSRRGQHIRHIVLAMGPNDEISSFSPTANSRFLVYSAAQSQHVHQLFEQLPGGGLRLLTHDARDHVNPAASSDGRVIADEEYEAPCGNCVPVEIGIGPGNGSGSFRSLPHQGIQNFHPTWSPDGSRIAFVSEGGVEGPGGMAGIVSLSPDGSNVAALSNHGTDPVWSPDGTRIAFSDGGIWVMGADGTNPHQVIGPPEGTGPSRYRRSPSWSPDGAQLAFAAGDGLYVMQADGSDPHSIVTRSGIGSVAWAPDGSRIAFAASCQSRTCGSDIWTIRPDGSDLTRMTTSPADDVTPAWLPVS